jgi:hypothetical protein
VGLLLLLVGNQRRNKRVLITGAVCVVLAGGVYLLSRIVTTGREAMTARSRTLVESTQPPDLAGFRGHFAPTATLVRADGSHLMDAPMIVATVERILQQYRVSDHEIQKLDAEDFGNGRGETDLVVRTRASDIPVWNRFAITWTRNADGQWVVSKIRWVELNNQEPPSRVP